LILRFVAIILCLKRDDVPAHVQDGVLDHVDSAPSDRGTGKLADVPDRILDDRSIDTLHSVGDKGELPRPSIDDGKVASLDGHDLIAVPGLHLRPHPGRSVHQLIGVRKFGNLDNLTLAVSDYHGDTDILPKLFQEVHYWNSSGKIRNGLQVSALFLDYF
jgi:hypothetical protein